MTGKDLIVYILKNNLENEPVFKDGRLLGFLTVEQASIRLGVGIETIKTMIKLGMIDEPIKIGDAYLIPEWYLENMEPCTK